MRDLRTITVEDASAVPATLCGTTLAFVSSLAVITSGCLPADPPGFRRDAGAPAEPEEKKAAPRAPSSVRSGEVRAEALTEPFSDDFARKTLGPAWRATSSAWRIEDGRLCAQNAKNRPIWLMRRLPANARVEFDAVSSSDDGDIKAEIWGDGRSAADTTSYDNATSYIAIFGGWKNTRHVLARLDEHAPDRKELTVVANSDDPRTQPVVAGRSYRFRLERDDEKTVRFYVDGVLIHSFADDAPLLGASHAFFGFNDWAVKVCFDNVLVTPLPETAPSDNGGAPGSPP